MSRSLNKVTLIGNLTRDPELRYTPQGNAVCTFSVATNRQWKTDTGEQKEDVEFHRVVTWNKLAEICSQYLTKGRKTYVEGRLQTRDWETKEGEKRTTTEIVANEMIILDSRGAPAGGGAGTVSGGAGVATSAGSYDIPDSAIDEMEEEGSDKEKVKSPSTRLAAKRAGEASEKSKEKKTTPKSKKSKSKKDKENEDIPF